MRTNPYESYKKQSIMSMTPGDMLFTLYSEVVKQCTVGKNAIVKKDFGETNRALQKAQKILAHLKATLDFKYDISNNLSALYDYFIEQIRSANIRKDTAPLDEVIPMITELQEAYAQADKNSRTKQA